MLTTAILVLATLGAQPAKPATDAGPAPASASSAPELEVVIPEKMLEDFLSAAAPFNRIINQEVAVLGFTKTVKLDLTLTRPRVRVTPAGVKVTMDYDLKGPGGMTSRGTATPKLDLVAVEGKNLLRGKLTGATLSATGGLEIPVEDLMDPVEFPAGASGPIQVGDSVVESEGRAREVILEDGRVRVKGDWAFKKAEKNAAAKAP